MKRWLSIAFLVLGCGKDRTASDQPAPAPTAKTSHPEMPNQFEVGSTIEGTYRVTKKLEDAGEYALFAVEPVGVEKQLVLFAPRDRARAEVAASLQRTSLERAFAGMPGEVSIVQVGMTPEGRPWAIAQATEAQVRQMLGALSTRS